MIAAFPKRARRGRSDEIVLAQFFSQGATVNSERFSRSRLIALAVCERQFQKWTFDFAQNQIIEIARGAFAEIAEISSQCPIDSLFEGA